MLLFLGNATLSPHFVLAGTQESVMEGNRAENEKFPALVFN